MARKKTFEAQLHALEEVVAKLENNELTLEQSLEEYKKGINLIKDCNKILENAQVEIASLTKDVYND
ncbi:MULTISPECIES: exodeoxyribonuclease VII small subunit [unclassified Gemella]|uniref:exodeoxyribonuclease VII small subunit n=1 Tax=unclassified Gemella TaxID=2624949 RepID=UPI001073CC27|nr:MULTISPECIES: exodeoxyribonuclease VII small subunit [unclassified Gemella]MBF0710697.1 exodeoxyribonuclease VII small subunit [Gemella sp. GL1.1]MBF0746734.1 exodeoxyribonuclease VII small subunit [Gemella sp. 19428wG2_WT2a]NYS28041.1 exodeoxyribonuclease VII small subunit [Gemella sp. GL1]TFU60082.1 exodeoxyribonuclease VII small subunit [Gemella sp. WT2a]